MMLAALVTGKADLADVLLLVATVLFAVAFVMRLMARAADSALVALGLTVVALAWLVL